MSKHVRVNAWGLGPNDRWFPFALALIFLLATIAPGPATSIMLDQDAGPYKVTVGASPVPLQVGQNHISVLIQRRSNALVVRNAQVTVTARPLEDVGPAITQPATHDQAADERQYGTPLVLEKPGRWEIVIQIEGPDGPATARFPVTVQRGLPVQPIIYLMMLAIPLTGALLILYWLRSGAKPATP